MGDESLPKIIINDTINLVFKTAISILVISNHNSFRVLFKIKLLPYILLKNIFQYFRIGNGQPREPALCQLYRRTFVPYRGAIYLCYCYGYSDLIEQ